MAVNRSLRDTGQSLRSVSAREQLGAAPGVSTMWEALAWTTQRLVHCVGAGMLTTLA